MSLFIFFNITLNGFPFHKYFLEWQDFPKSFLVAFLDFVSNTTLIGLFFYLKSLLGILADFFYFPNTNSIGLIF